MKLTKRQITIFQKKIFSWWKSYRRDLPWRRTRDPYRIMVSEVMLQQTQVSRVLPKYNEFLVTFPTVDDLAKATPAAVLRAWKGMGYNRRALYLHKAAKAIVEDYGGKFPKNANVLVKLPGLGTYTARAILVFAYKQEVPLVDTNIRQIITHFFFADQPQKASVIEDVARKLLPKGKSWQWHQALMDYGALRLSRVRGGFAQGKLSGKKPFKESNRFFRGRIIDRLREGSANEMWLLQSFSSLYDKPVSFLKDIIDRLLAEGLIIIKRRGVISLPEK